MITSATVLKPTEGLTLNTSRVCYSTFIVINSTNNTGILGMPGIPLLNQLMKTLASDLVGAKRNARLR